VTFNIYQKENNIMKKSLSILLAAIMAVSLASFPALAADSNLPGDDETVYIRLKGRDGAKTSDMAPPEIPVYGYVGPEEALIDPDPEDPEAPPIAAEVNVSVPVKIIWAAFEPETATPSAPIAAPNYYIQNRSSEHDLKVKLESFQPRSSAGNTGVDGYLKLNLVGKTNEFGLSRVLANGTSGTPAFPVNVGTAIAFSDTFTKGGTKWEFTLGGSWSGTFVTSAYTPIYDMVLVFSLPT
jgi:hypothetical protein